ncbi:MAG TPA: hypothetical protein VGG03_26170 [Thermoanaerobaculia bacterium]
MDSIVYAQLDTGAAWSILDSSIAHSLGLFETDDTSTKLDTRFGRIGGRLVRIPIRFVADQGTSLDANSTFFVSPDWPAGLTFLGYSGCLDSIRFALDPRLNHFYFGSGA